MGLPLAVKLCRVQIVALCFAQIRLRKMKTNDQGRGSTHLSHQTERKLQRKLLKAKPEVKLASVLESANTEAQSPSFTLLSFSSDVVEGIADWIG